MPRNNIPPPGHNPARKNPERELFHSTFAYLYLATTKTMVQKCWRNYARLPETQRKFMLSAMVMAAKAQAEKGKD